MIEGHERGSATAEVAAAEKIERTHGFRPHRGRESASLAPGRFGRRGARRRACVSGSRSDPSVPVAFRTESGGAAGSGGAARARNPGGFVKPGFSGTSPSSPASHAPDRLANGQVRVRPAATGPPVERAAHEGSMASARAGVRNLQPGPAGMLLASSSRAMPVQVPGEHGGEAAIDIS